jgi:hypothetical protein
MFDDLFSSFGLDHDIEASLNLPHSESSVDFDFDNDDSIFSDLDPLEYNDQSLCDTTDSDWIDPSNCIGDPVQDAQFWHQQSSPTSCALVSQLSIYESITGQHLSEDQVCEIAAENGWYDPDTGTSPSEVGKILNNLGISTEQHYDATLTDLADALERGDKVIVGLDANEVWHPDTTAADAPLEQPDTGHAVWVTGITQTEDGSVKILLNDSGTSSGQMSAINAKDFVNAWQDYGNFMMVAQSSTQPITA